jgi:hypothetical protein
MNVRFKLRLVIPDFTFAPFANVLHLRVKPPAKAAQASWCAALDRG